MTTEHEQNQDPQVPPAPPAVNPGDNGTRTYTKDEVEAKLRGQGAALKEVQDKLAAYEAKEAEAAQQQLEKKGDYDKAKAQMQAELEDARGKLTTLQEAETKRLENIAKQNTEAMKDWPDELKALVPEGLDARSKRDHIQKLAALSTGDTPVTVHGGPSRRPAAKTEDEWKAEQIKKGEDSIFGPLDGGDK